MLDLLAGFDSPLRSVAWAAMSDGARAAAVIGCIVIPAVVLCALAAGGRKERRLGLALVGVLALLWGTYARLAGSVWYVDPTCATPGDGTTSTCSGSTAPVDQFTDLTLDVNDTINVKAGTTVTGNTLTVSGLSGVTVGIYGGTERATIDCNNAVDYGIRVTQSDEFRFSDINIKRCRINNAWIDLTTLSSQMDVYLSRVHGSDITAAQSSNWKTGSSFWVETNNVGRLNITYTDVTCANVTSHCFGQYREVHSVHLRSSCNGAGIGGAYGAHCFTSSPRIHDWNSSNAWIDNDGAGALTIYRRPVIFSGDDEQAICGRGGTIGDMCLRKQAKNDTTLAVGEWAIWDNGVGDPDGAGAEVGCAAGGECVAVNFGFNPTVGAGNFGELKMARYPMSVVYIAVEAQGAVTAGGVLNVGAEGDGIVCDDLSIGCKIVSAYTHDNYRMGVQLRQTVGALVSGLISTRNAGNGILSQASVDTLIANATLFNTRLGLRVNTDYELGMTIRNVVSFGNLQNFIIDPQSAAQVTQSNNLSFAGTNPNDNFTAGLTSSPQLVGGSNPITPEQFRPLVGSVVCGAGTVVDRGMNDYFGQNFPGLPPLGAVRCPDARVDLVAANRIDLTAANRVDMTASNRVTRTEANALRLQ